LVDGALGWDAASAACQKLGEGLFSSHQSQIDTLKNVFSYGSYIGRFKETQYFWISKDASNGSCKAVDASGQVHDVGCSSRYPALCSQSAPVSNATWADKSSQFQIVQKVGKQRITGFRDFFSFRFLGVRYAPQPERFTYSEVYDGPANQSALNYGSKCAQPGTGSEDCLFLNIFTPALPSIGNDTDKLRPVMVWIHGGGFKTESNQDINHDGTNLASRGDVVIVQLNYRLGNLGFLAFDDNTSGNYGISDYLTGLKWVKKNIAAFGGDSERVTIFGESAGGAAVRALLASPPARGLFHRAIMQSSPAGIAGDAPFAEYQTVSESAQIFGKRVLDETGCSNVKDWLGCLRAYDAVELAGLNTAAT
jgi:hypothetical protein